MPRRWPSSSISPARGWRSICGPSSRGPAATLGPWAASGHAARRAPSPIAMPSSWSSDGRVAAGLIGYPLPDRPEPIPDTMPPMFVPLQELENLAPGTWYVNVLAAYPDQRGQGLGTALLAVADKLAAEAGSRGPQPSSSPTPIPAPAGSTSAPATARLPAHQSQGGLAEPGVTDWVLLVKPPRPPVVFPWRSPPARRNLPSMTDILDKITAYKLEEIAARQGRAARWRRSRRRRARPRPCGRSRRRCRPRSTPASSRSSPRSRRRARRRA